MRLSSADIVGHRTPEYLFDRCDSAEEQQMMRQPLRGRER